MDSRHHHVRTSVHISIPSRQTFLRTVFQRFRISAVIAYATCPNVVRCSRSIYFLRSKLPVDFELKVTRANNQILICIAIGVRIIKSVKFFLFVISDILDCHITYCLRYLGITGTRYVGHLVIKNVKN